MEEIIKSIMVENIMVESMVMGVERNITSQFMYLLHHLLQLHFHQKPQLYQVCIGRIP